MTAPAADEASEDQRRQDGERKEDNPRIDCSLLQRVHGLRGLDGRNRFAHDPPLNDVSDHQQIEQNQRQSAPAAGLGFANAAFLNRRILVNPSMSRNRSPTLRFKTYTTAFHKSRRIPPPKGQVGFTLLRLDSETARNF